MSEKYRILRRWERDEKSKVVTFRQLAKSKKSLSKTETDTQTLLDETVQLTHDELKALQKLAACYNKSLEYMQEKSKPWRFIWINLILGMAKGFGVAVGITVLAFIALKLLTSLQILNLPIIGEFIAELIDYINNIRNFGN